MSIPLTAHEALSGIFGSISLASWVFLLVPQLVENYRSASADGISLAFLFVWFIGDITNLAGALWAGLVPTVTALAVYFCFADTVLILQCLYYNHRNNRLAAVAAAAGAADTSSPTTATAQETDPAADEQQPLLSRRTSIQSNGSIGLPGSHRRRRTRSAASLTKIPESAHGSDILLQKDTPLRAALRNVFAIFAVCAVGTLAWLLAWRSGAWKPAAPPTANPSNDGAHHGTPLGAEILGYISAVAYLGARLPQIYKNWRDQSCNGLSLLFFLLSLLGNAMYGAGILFHSLEKNYILTNLPWLIGSLGTMVEDVMIFVQFHMYGDKEEDEDAAID